MRISPFDPPTLTPPRPRPMTSLDRRLGAQVHPAVLDGKTPRHAQGWRDLNPRRPSRTDRVMRAIPRLALAAAVLAIAARAVWMLTR